MKSRLMIRLAGVCLLLATQMGLLPAIQAADAPVDLVVTHVKVVSPPTVLEDVTVTVTGGRISYVGTAKFAGKAKRVIDGRNKTLIPGLIDTHLHLIVGPNSPDSDDAYDKWVAQRVPAKFQDLLDHGITTFMSPGDYWPQIQRVQEKLEKGTLAGPRMVLSGPMLVPVNGHGAADNASCTKVPFCRAHWVREISTEAQGRAIVKELAGAGLPGIKIAVGKEGNDGKPQGQFTPEVLQAIIDETHAQRMIVRAHAFPQDVAIDTINAGVDALVHGPELMQFAGNADPAYHDLSRTNDELIALAKKRHVPMTVTLAAVGAFYSDPWGTERLVMTNTPAKDMGKFADILRDYQRGGCKTVRQFLDAGILLAAGTDVWSMERTSFAEQAQIRELAKCGLTPMEILTVYTINGAKYLNMDKEIGSIEVDKRADLVLVAGDPTQNIDFLDRIDLVLKDGEIVSDLNQQRRAP